MSREYQKKIGHTLEFKQKNVDMEAKSRIGIINEIFKIKRRPEHKIKNDLWPISENAGFAAEGKLSRHHVISGQILTNLFNMLLGDGNFYPTLKLVLNDLLRNAVKRSRYMGWSQDDVLKLLETRHVINYLDENRKFARNEGGKIITYEDLEWKIIRHDEISIIQTLFFFRPDICFIGPEAKSRLSDPKADMDVEAQYIVPHYKMIHRFYEAILLFFENKSVESLEKVYLLHLELTKQTAVMFSTCSEDWMTVNEESDRAFIKIINETALRPEKLKKWKVDSPQIYQQESSKSQRLNRHLKKVLEHKNLYSAEIGEAITKALNSCDPQQFFSGSLTEAFAEPFAEVCKLATDTVFPKCLNNITQKEKTVGKALTVLAKSQEIFQQARAGSIDVNIAVENIFQLFAGDLEIVDTFFTAYGKNIKKIVQKLELKLKFNYKPQPKGETLRTVSCKAVKTFLKRQIERIITSSDRSENTTASFSKLTAEFFRDYLLQIVHHYILFLKVNFGEYDDGC